MRNKAAGRILLKRRLNLLSGLFTGIILATYAKDPSQEYHAVKYGFIFKFLSVPDYFKIDMKQEKNIKIEHPCHRLSQKILTDLI